MKRKYHCLDSQFIFFYSLPQLCTELEELAASVDLPSEEIIHGLKDGSLKKATGDRQIYKTVVEYLDAIMLCEMVLDTKVRTTNKHTQKHCKNNTAKYYN